MNPKVYKYIMIPIHIMIFPLWHIRRGIGKNNCLSPTEFRDLANDQSTLKLPSRFLKPYFRRRAGPGSHIHVVVFIYIQIALYAIWYGKNTCGERILKNIIGLQKVNTPETLRTYKSHSNRTHIVAV